MFVTFLQCIIIFSVPCEPNTTYEEQSALIEYLKERANINKIKTFYCKYTLLRDMYFLLGSLHEQTEEEHSIFEREIAWDNYFNKGNFLFTDFSNQKISNSKRENGEVQTKKKQEIHPEMKTEKKNDIPKTSLVNVIKSKLEQKVQQSIIQYDKINYEVSVPKNVNSIKSIYSIYKGKEYIVTSTYFDDGDVNNVKIEAPIPHTEYFSFLYAFLVVDIRQTGKVPYIKYMSLSEFLDSPGPFYISSEDGYTVLWHYTRIKISSSDNSEYEIPMSIDIWVDNNQDIYRIDFIHYYSRVMDIEKFHEGSWNDVVNCKYPCLLEKRIEYDSYQTFNENIRVPLHISIVEYKTDTHTEEGKKLELAMRNGDISPIQYLFNLTKAPRGINLKEEYFLDPNSIKVNQELSEEIFQIPEISQNNVKSKIINHYPLVLFVGGCILIVIIAIFLTNKYLGWSI